MARKRSAKATGSRKSQKTSKAAVIAVSTPQRSVSKPRLTLRAPIAPVELLDESDNAGDVENEVDIGDIHNDVAEVSEGRRGGFFRLPGINIGQIRGRYR